MKPQTSFTFRQKEESPIMKHPSNPFRVIQNKPPRSAFNDVQRQRQPLSDASNNFESPSLPAHLTASAFKLFKKP